MSNEPFFLAISLENSYGATSREEKEDMAAIEIASVQANAINVLSEEELQNLANFRREFRKNGLAKDVFIEGIISAERSHLGEPMALVSFIEGHNGVWKDEAGLAAIGREMLNLDVPLDDPRLSAIFDGVRRLQLSKRDYNLKHIARFAFHVQDITGNGHQPTRDDLKPAATSAMPKFAYQ